MADHDDIGILRARIEDLEPITRALCEAFLAECGLRGYGIRVTHTLRTMDEQAKLYAQGRTLPGDVVTRAKPGQSPHNYGLAFDICFAGADPYPDAEDPRWKLLGVMGEEAEIHAPVPRHAKGQEGGDDIDLAPVHQVKPAHHGEFRDLIQKECRRRDLGCQAHGQCRK